MSANQFFGKYRAQVTKVYDDKIVDDRGIENRGRIKVMCPKVLGEYESNWCEPSFNYCWDEHGDFVLPEIGDTVWVQFEEGNSNRPIWDGNWFKKDKTPIANPNSRDETPDPSAPPLSDYKKHHDKVRIIQYGRFWIEMHRDPDYMRVFVDDPQMTEFFTDLDQVYLERDSGKMKFFSNDEMTYLRRDDSELHMTDHYTILHKAGNTLTMTPETSTLDTPKTVTINTQDVNINATNDFNLNVVGNYMLEVVEGDMNETVEGGNITRKLNNKNKSITTTSAGGNADIAFTATDPQVYH